MIMMGKSIRQIWVNVSIVVVIVVVGLAAATTVIFYDFHFLRNIIKCASNGIVNFITILPHFWAQLFSIPSCN